MNLSDVTVRVRFLWKGQPAPDVVIGPRQEVGVAYGPTGECSTSYGQIVSCFIQE